MRFIQDRCKILNYVKTSRIIYDTEGEAQGIELSASSDTECNSLGIFLYRKNLQGDITGLINTEGKLLCEFTYDAYGNMKLHTESNLGAVLSGIVLTLFIPQLYRGYVYTVVGDEMCYYLGSRFYSPKLGRFLNADIHADTGTGVVGTNMFAYCNNNPVMFVDPSGEVAVSAIAAILGVPATTIFAMAGMLIIFTFIFTNGEIMLSFSNALALLADNLTSSITNVINAAKIPNKIKTGDGRIDLDKFKNKLPNGQGYKGPDNWKIVKDMAKHGGRAWKLYN